MRRRMPIVAALALGVLAAACSGPAGTASTTSTSTTPAPTTSAPGQATTTSTAPTTSTSAVSGGRDGIPPLPHVFVVVMENLGYTAALATPELGVLAQQYAYSSEFYATSHPSLPNYLAMTGGSTFGVTTDCATCYVSAPNIGSELSAAGISWGAYMQGVPRACYLLPYGGVDYASKHDPFVYYDNIRSSASLCAHIVPFGHLRAQLRGPASGVPRYVSVTPNLCNDGHNCSADTASGWLQPFVASITASAAWRQDGVLFVVWDEGNFSDTTTVGPSGSVANCCGGGHVLMLVIRSGLPAGFHSAVPYSQYSLLATIEDGLGVPLLGASAHAAPMTAFFPRS